MNYYEFSISRQEMRPRRPTARRYLLEAGRQDHAKCRYGQPRTGSLAILAGCRNIRRPLSPQPPQSAYCSADGLEVLIGERGRHHDQDLTMRHRRRPEEPEAPEPGGANSPGEEDPADEKEPTQSGNTEAETQHGNSSTCPGAET